jgi:sulfate transport system substrate-binding protein
MHPERKQVVEEADFISNIPPEERQELAAKNYYRPRDPGVAARYASKFPKIELFTIDAVLGGWAKAQPAHFGDGGVFDQIYTPGS